MRRNKLARYCLLGATIVILVVGLRGECTAVSLCDGFSLAGVLFLSYGGLRFLNAQHAFEGISYIGTRVKSLLFPFLDRGELYKRGDEGDFKYRKQENGKPLDGSALIIGAGYLSFAVLLLCFV